MCGMKSRVVGWHQIRQTLEIWRHSMDWNELHHPLKSLLSGMVFAFHLVFSFCGMCKGMAEISQRSETPSVPHWTDVCLTSLHTVILWCSMRCPVIWCMIGRPSASGACLFRENKGSSGICGNSPEVRAKELAFPLMERGSWLGVHRVAGLSFLGFSGN